MNLFFEMSTSTNKPAAVRAIQSAPTQPEPRKGQSEAKPRTLPPSEKTRCVTGK